MALERKDNDDQMEKLRMEADDVAAKVSSDGLCAHAYVDCLVCRWRNIRRRARRSLMSC